MLKMKESYGYGFRLFNTETGKYVEDTAENRREALFCLLVEHEIKLTQKGMAKDDHYSVEKIANYYAEALYLYRNVEMDDVHFKSFKNRLDENFGLYGLLDKEENQVLAYAVLKDQQNEKTKASVYDFDKLKNKYESLDEKIFAKELEQVL